MEQERQLWEMILKGIMPAPSGMDCDDDVLSALYSEGGVEEVVSVSYPWVAAAGLTVIIALLMLFFGFIDLSIAVFHPEFTKHRMMVGFTGALSVILGGIFFFLPALGALVLVAVYLGVFAIIYGILSIVIGVMVRGEQKTVTAG